MRLPRSALSIFASYVIFPSALILLIPNLARAVDTAGAPVTPPTVTPTMLVPFVDTTSGHCQHITGAAVLAACFVSANGDGCTSSNIAGERVFQCPAGMVPISMTSSTNIDGSAASPFTKYFNISLAIDCCPIVYRWASPQPCATSPTPYYCIQ